GKSQGGMERVAGGILEEGVGSEFSAAGRSSPAGNGIAEQPRDTLPSVGGPDVNPFEEQDRRGAAAVHIVMTQGGLGESHGFARIAACDERNLLAASGKERADQLGTVFFQRLMRP